MSRFNDMEQNLLASMREHISEAIASTDDELMSQFELESNEHSIKVRHPYGSNQLTIQALNGEINIYETVAGVGAWGSNKTIMWGEIFNTMGKPQIHVRHIEHVSLRGLYRFVLKAIDQDLGGVLQEEIKSYLHVLREEISICEEMWDIQKVTQS